MSLRHQQSMVSHAGSDAFLGEDQLEEDEQPPVPGSNPFRRRSPPPPPSPPSPSPPSTQASAPRLRVGNARMVIAIDYGTTYTGLAFARTNSDQADLKQIEVLVDWSPKMSNQQKVRSVIAYPEPVQWGSDVGEDAVTMVNTKLELEPQDTRFEELDLTLHVLKGTDNLSFKNIRNAGPDPTYTCRSPSQIVSDYLTKICERCCKEVNPDQLALTHTAVDIVITVPVKWSYQASDSMFKAIREAGFNKTNFPTLGDTIMVREPEAASYFTARNLRGAGVEFLDVEDVFILCDAGGGTVDAVSYQVKKVHPYFELEKATAPTGDKCGSALIDTAFKTWLRNAIGREEYAKIDRANAKAQRISPHTAESGAIRDVVAQFVLHKKTFSSTSQPHDIKIDLPEPLNELNIEGRVNNGELIIYRDEMTKLMNSCVNGVVRLIKNQIDKVGTDKSRRVKNVCLVGGFGASPYLQEKLKKSLSLRNKMELRRPDADEAMTAVVQGAVVYGIEKSRHKDAKYMSAITRSYGIVLDGRFVWLIKKGDLVLSNEKRHIQSKWFWIPTRIAPARKYDFPIYVYKGRWEDDLPSSYQTGKMEVEAAGSVKCDFSKFLDRDLRGHPPSLTPGNSDIGPLRCDLQLTSTSLHVEVLLNKTVVASCEIKVEVDWPRRQSTHSWVDDGDDD